jgi:hypothetical protein
MKIRDNLVKGDKVSAAFRTDDNLMGVIKLEFYPTESNVVYAVQHCTANETANVIDGLKESGGGFKELSIWKNMEELTVQCEGKTLVTVKLTSSSGFPG